MSKNSLRSAVEWALMVALDAMEITLFDKLLAAGRLPNPRRAFRKSGRPGNLKRARWPCVQRGASP